MPANVAFSSGPEGAGIIAASFVLTSAAGRLIHRLWLSINRRDDILPAVNQPPGPTPSPTSQNDHWRERGLGEQSWQRRFFHDVLRRLGLRPAYHMMYVVTFWYVLFVPAVRRRTRFYLSRRFPGRKSAIARFRESFRLIRNFGRTLVDLAAFTSIGDPGINATCPDEQTLYDLCDRKEGFILLNAHVGCWQVGMSSLPKLSKPMNAVMLPDPRAQAFLDEHGVRVVDPRNGIESVVEMLQALRRGEILGLMGDRAFGDHANTVLVRFLGGQVAMPISPYRIASATGAPIVVLLAPRTGPKAYQLRVSKIIHVARGLGSDAQAYAAPAQEFADCLESFVQNYPWQFYNFYDLWNQVGPDSEAAVHPRLDTDISTPAAPPAR